MLLGLALLLVFGIGRLVGGTGTDPGSGDVEASTTAVRPPVASPSVTAGPAVPSRTPRTKGKTVLLPPSGACRDDEVRVLPSVPRAPGGAPITITLALQGLQPACTFTVSPETVVVKITSGEDRIWSSQDCEQAVPESEVVVRSGVPSTVDVTWSGRRSEPGCPGQTDWALPGFYHVHAAAYGSTPSDLQFEVTAAEPELVTRTAKPRSEKSTAPGPASGSSGSSGKPATKPSGKPTDR